MRRLLPALLLTVLFALPSAAYAQEQAEEEAVTSGAGYEPDQRGVEDDAEAGTGGEGTFDGGDDQSSGGGDTYEPDQRGIEEEGRERQESQPMSADVEEAVSILQGESGYAGGGIGSSGVGLEFYFWLGGGLTGLDAIEGDNLLLPTQASSAGGSFGLTLGVRVGPVTVGPRFSLTVEPSFLLGAVGLDALVGLIRGPFVPTLRVGLSYAFVSPTAEALPSQNVADGLLVELGAGFRAHVGAGFFLGGELSAGYLALFRDEVPACVDPCTDGGAFDLRRPGSAHGLMGRLQIFAGWGF